MDTIISEIKRAIMFYQEKPPNEKVEVILITGGTARLPGMVMYIAEATGIEVQLGSPWLGIQREQRFMVLDQEGPTFCVAIGLALRP
jgi:type IV pilus assembly protein PilM